MNILHIKYRVINHEKLHKDKDGVFGQMHETGLTLSSLPAELHPTTVKRLVEIEDEAGKGFRE